VDEVGDGVTGCFVLFGGGTGEGVCSTMYVGVGGVVVGG